MAQTISIPFHQFANAMVTIGALNSPSGLHGWLAGYLSSGARLKDDQWQQEAQDYLEVADALPKPVQSLMTIFYGWVLQDLESDTLRFDLFLPEDDEADIEQQITALADWCKGFLDGFGASGAVRGELPEDVAEVLEHFDAISQAELGDTSTEEADSLLIELREHGKVAALTVFMAFNEKKPEVSVGESGQMPTPPPQSLH